MTNRSEEPGTTRMQPRSRALLLRCKPPFPLTVGWVSISFSNKRNYRSSLPPGLLCYSSRSPCFFPFLLYRSLFSLEVVRVLDESVNKLYNTKMSIDRSPLIDSVLVARAFNQHLSNNRKSTIDMISAKKYKLTHYATGVSRLSSSESINILGQIPKHLGITIPSR